MKSGGNKIIGNWIGPETWSRIHVGASNQKYNAYSLSSGIEIWSSGNVIEKNRIGGAENGIWIIHVGGGNSVIRYNFIGLGYQHWYTDLNWVPRPNGVGILVNGPGNIIEHNIIAGNNSHGIEVHQAKDNYIGNNEIGAWSQGRPFWCGDDKGDLCGSGTLAYEHEKRLDNGGDGIYVHGSCDNTRIGKPSTIELKGRNYIADNKGYGIRLSFSKDCVIGNNKISRNSSGGIFIDTARRTTIGSELSPNIIVGSGGKGGLILSNSQETLVEGNLIGVNESGGKHGNSGNGINLEDGSYDNTINKNHIENNGRNGVMVTEGAHENLISANWIGNNLHNGVVLDGSDLPGANPATKNYVEGNLIGLKWTGSDLDENSLAPNMQSGIWIGGEQNTIGGLNKADGNLIVANNSYGILVEFGKNNQILNNLIGTDGIHSWGNKQGGIQLFGAYNYLSLNEIAYNGSSTSLAGGINILGEPGNFVIQNEIYKNFGKGIASQPSKYVTPLPDFSLFEPGQVLGHTCSGCRVQIFSDDEDEGRIFEGFAETNKLGIFSFKADSGSFKGPNLTAIATDVNNDLNSSEFAKAP